MKRTDAQLDFDMAKKGWVFCNLAMLEHKLAYLEGCAKHLKPEDKRHEILAKIRLEIQTRKELLRDLERNR